MTAALWFLAGFVAGVVGSGLLLALFLDDPTTPLYATGGEGE